MLRKKLVGGLGGVRSVYAKPQQVPVQEYPLFEKTNKDLSPESNSLPGISPETADGLQMQEREKESLICPQLRLQTSKKLISDVGSLQTGFPSPYFYHHSFRRSAMIHKGGTMKPWSKTGSSHP